MLYRYVRRGSIYGTSLVALQILYIPILVFGNVGNATVFSACDPILYFIFSSPIPFKAKFEFHHGDYEKHLLHVLSRKDKTGIVLNNPTQSVFLFIDRQHLQVIEV